MRAAPETAARDDRLDDRAERERIRTSLDESLIVEAAAGTGKTTELVRRLVNVLAQGRGTVQSVVAVTFTEKAAGELKLRLRAGLEEARASAPAGSAAHENLERAIAELEEARISTIHGFCRDLLQERPVEAGLDPQFQVLDEAEARALYGEAFDRWLERVLEDPPEGVRRALRRPARRRSDESPSDRLRDEGWRLGAWRDLPAPWRRPELHREAAIDRLVEAVHALADRLASDCTRRSDDVYWRLWRLRRLSADVRPAERVHGRDYDALEAALVELAETPDFRKPGKGNPRNYRSPEALEEILTAHAQLLEQLDIFARLANADLAALLHAELRETIEAYEALKRRAGRVDFFDLLLRLRDLVRDRADVRAEWQARFSHVFVDEFQDTDPLQAEILLLLAAADPAVDQWRDAVPAPGKLFVVGDPKQSIYRFRRADVGIYQEVKQRLSSRGVACLELRTSFRAVPGLQRLVNAAFGGEMVEDRATLQAGYVPLAPARPPIPGQPYAIALPVPRPHADRGITKRAIAGSLPDAVAALVRWMVDESGWRASERDAPAPVPLQARHVCLLFRRFSTWDEDVTRPYVEALEARGLPHLLVGGKSFHAREEVESVRTALTAVEWPDDELAVYATLKGPLFAIGDEELVEFRRRARHLHPFRPPKPADGEPLPDRLQPVVEALALLRELHARRNARPVEETLRALLGAARAHAGFVLRPWGEQALANVQRIAELARRYEANGALSFRGFVERLRDEADDDAPEAPIVEEESDGVRLMTVHRAKGLEFPVVILADVTANVAPERPGRHVDAARGLCAIALGRWLPLDLLEHEAEEAARERAEGLRIAYVAATRARDLLVVPVLGDDPFATGWEPAGEGWVAAVQRALYPDAGHRRLSRPAPGCPTFGDDSVLVRPDDEPPGPDNVKPGLHELGLGETAYEVVWWDPRALALDVKPRLGIRRRELLEDPADGTPGADRQRYEAWRADRDAAIARGAEPSLRVRSAVEWTHPAGGEGAADEGEVLPVELVDVGRPSARPTGPRFGTLVHAVLATVDLDAGSDAVRAACALEARVLGATPEEAAAAEAAVGAVLAHPLMARARAAAARGRCCRETPVAGTMPGGVLVEGVVDLAFEDDAGWTVVDFKTDAEIGGALERYRRQVALYAVLVGRATGRPAAAVLLRV